MEPKLSKVLDNCLAQVNRRRSIKGCLAEHPAMSQQLEPLLNMASSVVAVPRVSPSDEFRTALEARLRARLSEDRARAKAAKPGRTALTVLSGAWQGFLHTIATSRRIAIPVTAALLLVLASALSIFLTSGSTSPTASLASRCTLSILSGSVEWQNSGSAVWEEATDGLTLQAGNRVRTEANSEAMLTFFEGSTITLEANTEIEIQQADTDGEHTNITLRQWFGRTWSRVVHMVDPGSHYEIQTPSATAIVRGTLFMTEVGESGSTTVQTYEGLVAVSAQIAPTPELVTTESVDVPAGYEASVPVGEVPSQPTPFEPTIQIPGGQGSQGEGSEEQNENTNEDEDQNSNSGEETGNGDNNDDKDYDNKDKKGPNNPDKKNPSNSEPNNSGGQGPRDENQGPPWGGHGWHGGHGGHGGER